MTSPLRYFRHDPMRKGRGAGFYYRRSYKGNTHWLSKFEATRDAHRKVKIAHKHLSPRYEHTGDKVASRRTTRRLVLSRGGRGRKIFGWL